MANFLFKNPFRVSYIIYYTAVKFVFETNDVNGLNTNVEKRQSICEDI